MVDMAMSTVNSKKKRRRGRKSDANENEKRPETKKSDAKKDVSRSDDNRNGKKSKSASTRENVTSSTAPQPLQQQHSTLLFQLNDDEPTWYQVGKHQAGRNATIWTDPPPSFQKDRSVAKTTSMELVQKYRTQADNIYRRELELFNSKTRSSDSDERWVESTIKKGTLKDRIAAMSVVVSQDPLHKFHTLDGLLSMAGCSQKQQNGTGGGKSTNSRVAHLAAEALEDLFLNTFLPHNRKLITLAQRPLYLYEAPSKDQGAAKNKKQTVKSLSPRILLLWRFEEMVQEKYTLFLRHYLTQTLAIGMEQDKLFAIRCSTNLLRNVPEGESTLLQLVVNKLGDPGNKVAAAAAHELRRVLQQHPAMQVVIAREVQQLAHRPRLSSRALYNCITFLNQLKLSRDVQAEQAGTTTFPASLISTYFRLFEVAVKVTSKDDEAEAGRKSRLLSALLTGVNRAHPYLPEKDQDMDEHIDALYRVVHTSQPSACTQALLLLFHVSVGSKIEEDEAIANKDGEVDNGTDEERKRQDRFYRALYATLARPALLRAGKHSTMFFNLLYKALKYDTDGNRVIAFCKRIMCSTLHNNASVVAASLFLLNEIAKYHPTLRPCLEGVLRGPDALRVLDPSKREPRGALIVEGESPDAARIPGEERKASMWELALTAHHFHPSVVKFTNLMGDINYNGDPLRDFSLAPFLDKFAYRNPKSAEKVASKFKRGESVAERRSGTDRLIEMQFALPLNDPSFAAQTNVSAQDEFFHRFFVERTRRDTIKGIERRAKGADDDELSAEKHAFEAAEEVEVDHKFEEFESRWEDDSEEEAFVNSLAEKIMEDSIPDGLVDVDEDPDMEGWDDMHDGDEDAASVSEVGEDDVDKHETFKHVDSDDDFAANCENDSNDDDDAFMDYDSSDDNGEDDVDDDDELQMNGKGGKALALDNQSLEHDSADDESDTDNDHEYLALAHEDESDDSDARDEASSSKSNKKHRSDITATFASVEDYEAMIQESWSKLKQSSHQSEDENSMPQENHSGKALKRTRKRRHNSSG